MAFAIVSRALLRSSREILERNLTVGTVNVLAATPDLDNVHHAAFVPQRGLATGTFLTAYRQQKLLERNEFAKAVAHAERQYAEKHMISAKREEDSDSDSDSDDFERTRKRMQAKNSQRGDSEFWRRKMRTIHRILDINHDGVVSIEDFNLLAQRFNDLGHLTPAVYAEFQHVMLDTWEVMFGEVTPYNLKTAEQFMTDLHHRLNDKKMIKRIGRFLPYLFKAVDYDHTGHLDLEQYKLFFRCLGLSNEDAAISFAVIDENGDGQISMKEFNKLGRQFFITEDDSKISKMFWGPLIDH